MRTTRPRNATIKDVAREAGVAISTVSAVVNASKPVSAELAERVRAAIKKLDFRPNAEGLAWFLDSVLPGLFQRVPNARFFAVGANPPEWLVRRGQADNRDLVRMLVNSLVWTLAGILAVVATF